MGRSKWSHRNDDVVPPDGDAPAKHLRRRIVAFGLAAVGVAATAIAILPETASADPSPHTWFELRMCESSDNYRIDSGNGHYGAYQFDLSTWQSVGGHGFPQDASPAEQDARALILYRERGWQPWQCAAILGLQPDADAGSGFIADIHVPTSGGFVGHRYHDGTPAYPSDQSYRFGESSTVIKRFQDQMHKRGAIPPGTGYYGRLTLAVAKRLQALNGLPATGLLGPLTWHAAFKGRYSPPPAATPTPAPPTSPPPTQPPTSQPPTTQPPTSQPPTSQPPTTQPPAKQPAKQPTQPVKQPTAPAFPGTHSFRLGDTSVVIKQFQDQLHRRGALPPGSGYYGKITLAVVKRLQQLNGLPVTGLLGPLTWRAAFTGTYSPGSTAAAVPASGAPLYPAKHSFREGDRSIVIKWFQDQMHERGAIPAGTGYYGPLTRAVVLRLQRANGLRPTGLLGPLTWHAAFKGKY